MYRSNELPPAVRGYLSDFVQRWRRLVAMRAVGSALAGLAIWIIVACTADRFLHLESAIRLGLLAAAGLIALAVGLYRLRQLRAPVDWVSIAHIIESQDRVQPGKLIHPLHRASLVRLEHRGSEEILSQLLRDVDNIACRRRKAAQTHKDRDRRWDRG